MKKPRAIIFDLDDTLVLSDGAVESTWNEACEAYVNGKPHLTAEKLFNAVREVSIWYWSDADRHREGRNALEETRRFLVRRAFENLGLSDIEEANRIADHYSRRKMEKITIFPKSYHTLEEVKKRNIRLGLLTNGERHLQRAKIERFKLEPYFDVIQVEGEMGFGKPEEQAYHTIVQALKSDPAETWIVGDNFDWEVKIPQKLGLHTVWHNYYRKKLPPGDIRPHHTIQTIEELIPLIPQD